MKELQKHAFEGVVMVCDDNIMNVMVICKHLERVGLKTIVAQNGNDGVEKVRMRAGDSSKIPEGDSSEKKPDKQFALIFMDIHMPVMDGLEASKKINEIDSNIPVVALTTDKAFEDKNTYKDSGIVDYLGKPFTTEELLGCLNRHLNPSAL